MIIGRAAAKSSGRATSGVIQLTTVFLLAAMVMGLSIPDARASLSAGDEPTELYAVGSVLWDAPRVFTGTYVNKKHWASTLDWMEVSATLTLELTDTTAPNDYNLSHTYLATLKHNAFNSTSYSPSNISPFGGSLCDDCTNITLNYNVAFTLTVRIDWQRTADSSQGYEWYVYDVKYTDKTCSLLSGPCAHPTACSSENPYGFDPCPSQWCTDDIDAYLFNADLVPGWQPLEGVAFKDDTTTGTPAFDLTVGLLPAGACTDTWGSESCFAATYGTIWSTNCSESYPCSTNWASFDMGAASSVVIPMAGSAANYDYSGTDGDPVNTYTGEYFFSSKPDLYPGGPMSLYFGRYYASGLKQSGVAGSLGDNWTHNFEWSLTVSGTDAAITSDKGRIITFSDNGTSWDLTGSTNIPFQFVQSGGDYVLYDPGIGLLYTFDSAGALIKVEDGKGNIHTLTYSGTTLTQVSDGLGRTLTFTYDGNSKLSTVSDGTRTVTFAYTGDDLTSVTDASGNATQYTYETGGLMTKKTLPENNSPYTQTYNADGTVATQTDALGNTNTITYNSPDTTMTDPLGNTRKHTHSSNGEITANQRQYGNSASMGYDSNGRRNTVTDLLGDTTTYTYHTASGKLASVTNTDGTITTYTYTSRPHSSGIVFYDLTGRTYPDTTTVAFVYDTSGNMTSRTDRDGNVWVYT